MWHEKAPILLRQTIWSGLAGTWALPLSYLGVHLKATIDSLFRQILKAKTRFEMR